MQREKTVRKRETPAEKLERLTQIERGLWDRGLSLAGIDEVGRGPLAGPVVTACVSIPRDRLVPGVDDSKKLSEKKREQLYPLLMEAADYAETCFIGLFLIDAVEGLRLPREARAIVHGDALSYMIGAASVVAKVTRDRYMVELDAKYPMYGFARNKGYGTAEHIAALKKYGPCPEHRRSFIGKILGGSDE